MITLNGRQFRVSYVGDCDLAWNNPEPGSSLTVNIENGQLDNLTRTYRTRLDKKASIEALLKKTRGKADFEYPTMFMNQWTSTEDGHSAAFNITFKGLHDNRAPAPHISGGIDLQNVSVKFNAIDAESFAESIRNASVSISYESPFKTVRYVSKKIPVDPVYVRTGFPTGAIDIKQVTGAMIGPISYNRTASLRGVVPANTNEASAFRLNQILQVTGPTYEQSGTYFECQETYRLLLIEAELQERVVKF